MYSQQEIDKLIKEATQNTSLINEKEDLGDIYLRSSILLDECIEKQTANLTKIMRDAFLKHGFDIEGKPVEELKKYITKIIIEDDDFEHFYLHWNTEIPIRIISMQKNPTINNDFSQNPLIPRISANWKYY